MNTSPDNTFFISDTHFGHRGIITHCKRPFSSPEEMDGALIHNWNKVVPRDGIVYHLGDVSFHRSAITLGILSQLNGRIYLVRGNHDHNNTNAAIKTFFREIWDYKEITLGGHKIVMCHYPLESWNQMHYESWHLHGHSHGHMREFGLRMDVGVDCHGLWAPMSYRMLEAKMATRKMEFSDHHKPTPVKIYLDDTRPAPDGWVLMKTPKEVINALKKGNVEELSLDHDLGSMQYTGYDVLVWLEEQVMCNNFKPPKQIHIHTANSVAYLKMKITTNQILARADMEVYKTSP